MPCEVPQPGSDTMSSAKVPSVLNATVVTVDAARSSRSSQDHLLLLLLPLLLVLLLVFLLVLYSYC